MKNTELLPYFYPTQVVFVDADSDYQDGLGLQLDADLAYVSFTRPDRALAYINARAGVRASFQRFFTMDQQCDAGEGKKCLRLNFNALAREMHFTARFAQISVVLVANEMPVTDGLTLCQTIRDPAIKKILFTDGLGEDQAIDAFNRGLIDRYIRKSEPRVYETLNHTIRELQIEHIRDLFAAAGDILGLETPDLLADPAVIDLMTMLESRYGVVEYYLACRPWGFLLVDGDGDVHRLVLCDAHDRDAQIAWAKAHDAPAEYLDRLAAGNMVLDPALITGQACLHADVFREGSEHMRAATRLFGERDYVWAVFDQRRAVAPPVEPTASYNDYLEWIDALSYSMT